MKTIGVILARGGSQGLRNKHTLDLLGRPVIDYTFEEARRCARIDRVVVSSDCADVLRLARVAGFDTIARPATLATSTASVQGVMLHARRELLDRGMPDFDAFAVLYGNVPVRPAGCVDRALELLDRSGCDSVRSFSSVGKWHPMWMSRLRGDIVEPLHGGSIDRRQDLEPLHLHDGAALVMSRRSLLRGLESPNDPHAFFGVDRRGIVVEPGEAIEIDTPRDFLLAEATLRHRGAGRLRAAS